MRSRSRDGPPRRSLRVTLVAVALIAVAGTDRSIGGDEPPPLFLGVIARTSTCPGSFIVLQRSLDELIRESSRFRPLPETAGPSADSPLMTTVASIRQRLDSEHVWLFAGRPDGVPELLLIVPDRPADQVVFWQAVRHTLLHVSS